MARKRKASQPPPPVEDDMLELHRSGFVEWAPRPVMAVSASGDGSLAAALREDGDIELYDTASFYLVQVRQGMLR